MIRRSTVVYILILVVVAGAYFYLKLRKPPVTDVLVTPEVTEQISYLFTAEGGVPTSIQIESKSGEIVAVMRDVDNAWVVFQPLDAKAEQGSSEAAATQVMTMRILDKVTDVDPSIVGLNSPDYLLTVKFNSDVERTVKIGVVTPSESGYYVQDASGGDVFIVSKSAVDALLSLLTNPPYLETLTPNPTTPTVLSTGETATPQP